MTLVAGGDVNKSGGAVSVRLALLGKHPIQDDFLEGMGARTPLLSRLNEQLVFNAVGDLDARGKWNGSDVLPGSPARWWSLLRQEGASYLVAVMSPSADGKGRKFPLVLAAEVPDAATVWGERVLLPVLAETVAALKALRGGNEVVALLGQAQARCDRAAAAFDPTTTAEERLRAHAFLTSEYMRHPAERRLRIFHPLREHFSDLAPGARVLRDPQAPHFEVLRLPAGMAGQPALANWLAVLRGQIHQAAPILLAQAEGMPWLDVFVGGLPRYPDPTWKAEWGEQPLRRTLACLQMDQDAIKPEDQEPYVLPPGFEADVQRAVEGYQRAWGDPRRHSIFGPVPKDYAPAEPGLPSPSPASGRLLTFLKRRAVTRPERPRRSSTWLIAAAVVGGIALVTALLGLIGGAGGRLPADAPDQQPVARLPQPRSPAAKPGAADLEARWRDYRGAYDRWLGTVATSSPGASTFPLAVQAAVARVTTGASPPLSLEPAELLGSKDPVNIQQPSPRLLETRQERLLAAFQAREYLENVLVRECASNFTARVQALEPTPLQQPLQLLSLQFNRSHSSLVVGLAPPTNGLTPSAPLPGLTNLLAEMRRTEDELQSLAAAWDGWQHVRGELTQQVPTTLPPLLARMEAALNRQQEVNTVVSEVAELRSQAERTLAWAVAAWSNVDQQRFEAEWQAQSAEADLAAWTKLAAGFEKGFRGEDPRLNLKARWEQVRPEAIAGELTAAARRGVRLGVDAEQVTSRLADLQRRLQQLANIPALRQTETEVRQGADALARDLEEWERLVQPAWIELFDLRRLVERERVRDFGLPSLNEIWTNRLERATADALTKSEPQSPEAMLVWRDQFQRAAEFLYALAKRPAWPDVADLENTLPHAGPAREELLRRLQRDFLELQVRRNLDDQLVVRRSLPEYLASPEAQADVAGAVAFAGSLDAMLHRWARLSEGGIPSSLASWHSDFHRLLDSAEFALTRRHPACQTLLEELAPLLSRPIPPDDLLQKAPAFDRPQLSLALAVAQQVAAIPPSLDRWRNAIAWWRLAERKAVGEPQVAGVTNWITRQRWLDESWVQVARGFRDWREFKAAGEATLAAGLARAHWPALLSYQAGLAELVLSFDRSNARAFQERVKLFVSQPPPTPGYEQVLRRILSLPPSDQTDWARLEPALRGYRVEPLSEQRVRVSFGSVTQEFLWIDRPPVASVFVAVSEVSAGFFLRGLPAADQTRQANDWVSGLARVRNALTNTFVAPGRPIDWPVFCFSQLTLETNSNVGPPRLRLRSRRFDNGPLASVEALRRFNEVSEALPVNFVSARSASDFANRLGCRLLTPTEWEAVTAALEPEPHAVLRTESLDRVLSELLDRLDWQKGDKVQVLFHQRLGTINAPPSSASRSPLFAQVDDPQFAAHGVLHWRGNVAEYLADGVTFAVAGGSLATPADSEAALAPAVLSPGDTARGFADVGLRLAFSWNGRRLADEIARLLGELRPERTDAGLQHRVALHRMLAAGACARATTQVASQPR